MEGISTKKLLIGLFILVIFLGIGGVFLYKKMQKSAAPTISPQEAGKSAAPTISPQEAEANCLTDVSKMGETQLIEKISLLPGATADEFKKINNLMVDSLVCDLRENPIRDNYDQMLQSLDKIRIIDEARKSSINRIKAVYPDFQKDNEYRTSYLALLATGEQGSICPQNNQTKQLVETCLEGGSDKSSQSTTKIQFCNTICERVDKYSKNKTTYSEEISGFINGLDEWFKQGDFSSLEKRYFPIVALVFRFGGENDAVKLCDRSPSTEIKRDCFVELEKWKKINLQKNNCETILEELSAMICKPR